MSDDGSWREYKREISKHIATHSTCVVFLGVFLSHAVRYESYQQLKRYSRLQCSMPVVKKMSVCETFTVLEAITVRNRLRQLSRLQMRRVGRGGRVGSDERGGVVEEEREVCILSDHVNGEDKSQQKNGMLVPCIVSHSTALSMCV